MNIFIAIVFSIIFISIFFIKSQKKSHKWRIISAKKTLLKLRAFEHDGQILNYLKKIDAFVFEELLLFVFNENDKIEIIRNKKYTGDGGIDGTFFINKSKYLIQAKRYNNFINISHIKKFSEDINKNRALKGYFIHTGKTRKSTKNIYKEDEKIEIISGDKLVKFIRYGNIQY